MLGFIVRRLLALIPLLLGISLMVFLLMYMAPGDFLDEARMSPDISPELVEDMERQFGLDRPWYVQYGLWLKNVASLNFGESWAYKVPVLDLLKQRIPATLILSISSILFAWGIAIPLGVLAAIYKDSIFDRVSALFAYAALSIPEFFLALLVVYFAAVSGWFPTGGRSSIGSEFLPFGARMVDYGYHLILPTIVLGLGSVAGMMRIMRANFLDYLRAEFVNTARAKGLPEGVVMFRHVLRNAINPLITAFGFAFSTLLSGALLVENVMNYPGLGQLIFEAFLRQDQYVVMAAVVIGSLMLMTGNLLADLLLAWSDPRIRLEQPETAVVRGVRRRWRPLLFWVIAVGLVYMLSQWLPWQEEGFRNASLNVLKIAGGLLLTLLALMIIRSGGPLMLRLLRELMRRPLGLCAFLVLCMLYGSALFAPFIAPYRVNESNLNNTFHPPTQIIRQDGRFQVRVYENVDPSAARYAPIDGVSVPLKFFARGEPYRLFGIIPWDRHLVLPDLSGAPPLPEGPLVYGPNADGQPDRRDYPLYLLGSDSTGRDVFSRLLFGAQISLSIGLIGISITMVMGFLVGGLAGYFGGKTDFFAMRAVEFLMAIPGLYLLLALRSALAPYFESAQMYMVIIIILAFIGWAGAARIIRGMSLSIRRRPFVLASESMGQGTLRILQKHILPNLTSYLLVAATLSIPAYILGEAALSFLGLGIQEPSASWGLMLKQAQDDMKVLMLNFWWMLTPGMMIFITVIAFNLLGDTLRDIVDPKMKNLR